MKAVTNAVIHCSDSLFGDATFIDSVHRSKGWKSIGYHYVVLNGFRKPGKYSQADDGRIEGGRQFDNDNWVEENEIGAHALGFNENSVGICLIGTIENGKPKGFTIRQYMSSLILCRYLQLLFPGIRILGHNETGAKKACPVIDMNLFRKRLDLLGSYGLDIVTVTGIEEGRF